MMGGCSGYTDSFMYNVYEFKEVLSIILIAGLKWGGIAFFTGILICFFIAGYVVMERANEKQKLIKRISQVKEHKKNELDSLKKDYELSEKTINNNFQRRVNEKNEDIRLIEEQKARKEKEYTEEAQAKINEELKKLEVVCEAKEMADVEKDAA
jgi:biopolymer transport protein ExbB/TolQ